MRRLRGTINNKYVQPLKLGISSRLVVSPNVDYNSILLRNTHRAPEGSEYSLKLHASFNTTLFDGIYVLGYLERSGSVVSSSGMQFRIYSVSLDGLWTETLLHTGSGVSIGARYKLDVTGLQLGSPQTLDGELVLAVEGTVSRGRDSYKSKVYLNHLGVYESIVSLRNKVRFLEITKKDEGPV